MTPRANETEMQKYIELLLSPNIIIYACEHNLCNISEWTRKMDILRLIKMSFVDPFRGCQHDIV